MASKVKIPRNAEMDYDFIAFSFNGYHSYEDLNIVRVSDGDRYNDALAPTMADKTAEVPGGDGAYFFGTQHKQRQFNINFAFDGLKEGEIRKLKKVFNGKEMGDLWFAEAPYKVYTAKVTSSPTLKYLAFDELNKETGIKERVYKGEGTVQFTAYYPYAHTPDFVINSGEGTEQSRQLPGNWYTSYANFSNYDSILEHLPLASEEEGYGDMDFWFVANLISPNSSSTSIMIVDEGGIVLNLDGIESEQITLTGNDDTGRELTLEV